MEEANVTGVQGETQKKSKTGIQAKLVKSFLKVATIVSVPAVLAVVALIYMSSSYNNALKNYGFSQGDIGKSMAALAEARSAVRGAIGYDETDQIERMKETYEEKETAFATYIADVEQYMVTDDGKEAYAEIQKSLEGYWELSDEILAQGSTTDTEASIKAQKRVTEELDPKFDTIYTELLDLMNVNIKRGDQLQKNMVILKVILVAALVVLILIAGSFALKLGINISKAIAGPLAELKARLNHFAHGDLDSPFPEVTTEDEIAEIIISSEQMAANLNEIISDLGIILEKMANGNFAVDTAVEEKYEGKFTSLLAEVRKLIYQLNGTLNQINEATEQVSAGSNQLAQSAQDLAEGATDQAGAVQQLTATIEDITNISEKSAENTQEAADKAKASANNADRSREDMMELTAAMSRIMQTSEEIENIIVTIEDIASQTNLLSLNASIEAARAGEAGKGFAVVADQIGKLASDSAQSAVTTKELIIKALEEIRKGNQIVDSTMVTIGEVLEGMKEFSEVAHGTAQASREQADMLKQIESGIEQISMVVQSNSAASEETSAVSEELSAQATSLEEMVEAFELKQN